MDIMEAFADTVLETSAALCVLNQTHGRTPTICAAIPLKHTGSALEPRSGLEGGGC